MSGKCLLDTNILVALFNKDKSVLDKIKKGADVSVSSIAIGELYFGAEKSEQKKSNLDRINDLANTIPVMICDQETAKHYGKIKNLLKSKGTPIPENDIWIAAIAQQHNFVLVTRDEHFKHIEKITLAEW